MYRTAGNISKNPNVALLFVNFDGKSRRIRINGYASIHHDAQSLKLHFGAKFVVRIKCEIYPNCPRYVPNLHDKELSVQNYTNSFVQLTKIRSLSSLQSGQVEFLTFLTKLIY